jgi:predicted RNase H-like HicB family nuclease
VKIKIIVHEADEGGYWAEVPGLPGCFSQGETREELMANIREAIEGYLLVANLETTAEEGAMVVELAV